MKETTSALFHQLSDRESGYAFLHQSLEEPTCAQMLQTLLVGADLSARSGWPPLISANPTAIRSCVESECQDGTSCCARPCYWECR